MEQNENENVERGRIVDDYKHSIIQSVEHDEMKHGDTAEEREQYNERSHQLDENEVTAKEAVRQQQLRGSDRTFFRWLQTSSN